MMKEEQQEVGTSPRTLPKEFWEDYSLKWLFGDTPATRVLQYLLVHDSSDMTLREIARQTHVGYRTFYRYIPKLIELEALKVTRTIGPAKLYTLNKESKIVTLLGKLALEVAFKNAEILAPKLKPEIVHAK